MDVPDREVSVRPRPAAGSPSASRSGLDVYGLIAGFALLGGGIMIAILGAWQLSEGIVDRGLWLSGSGASILVLKSLPFGRIKDWLTRASGT